MRQTKMHSIVKECLEQHQGGEVFFDLLDDTIRTDNDLLRLLTVEVLKNKFDYIICSGTFGILYKNFIKGSKLLDNFDNRVIIVNGGLRKGNEIIPFYNTYDCQEKQFIFIDDSFYLGRTRNKIKETIEENGGILLKTIVLYDGSREQDSSVESFYRYYDNF